MLSSIEPESQPERSRKGGVITCDNRGVVAREAILIGVRPFPVVAILPRIHYSIPATTMEIEQLPQAVIDSLVDALARHNNVPILVTDGSVRRLYIAQDYQTTFEYSRAGSVVQPSLESRGIQPTIEATLLPNLADQSFSLSPTGEAAFAELASHPSIESSRGVGGGVEEALAGLPIYTYRTSNKIRTRLRKHEVAEAAHRADQTRIPLERHGRRATRQTARRGQDSFAEAQAGKGGQKRRRSARGDAEGIEESDPLVDVSIYRLEAWLQNRTNHPTDETQGRRSEWYRTMAKTALEVGGPIAIRELCSLLDEWRRGTAGVNALLAEWRRASMRQRANVDGSRSASAPEGIQYRSALQRQPTALAKPLEVQAFCSAWGALQKADAHSLLIEIVRRHRMADLWETYRAVEAVVEPQSRGVSDRTVAKTMLFHTVYPKHQSSSATTKAKDRDWGHFARQLRHADRWAHLRETLGYGIFALMPRSQLPTSFIEQSLTKPDLALWARLIMACCPRAVELGAAVDTILLRLEAPRRRTRLETRPFSWITGAVSVQELLEDSGETPSVIGSSPGAITPPLSVGTGQISSRDLLDGLFSAEMLQMSPSPFLSE